MSQTIIKIVPKKIVNEEVTAQYKLVSLELTITVSKITSNLKIFIITNYHVIHKKNCIFWNISLSRFEQNWIVHIDLIWSYTLMGFEISGNVR